jgi:hypothetical protein
MLNMGAQQTPLKVDRVPHISMLKENNIRSQKQETYLQAQMGTFTGTVSKIENKKGQTTYA